MQYIIDYFNEFRLLVVNNYGVDPTIFIVIYLVATPFYYWGAYLAGKEFIVFRKLQKQKKQRFNLHKLLLENGFLKGYSMNRVSWVSPYAYVIMVGEKLPGKFYFLIAAWTLVSSYIFIHNLKNKSMLTRSKKR